MQLITNKRWGANHELLVFQGVPAAWLLNLPHKYLADVPVIASIDTLYEINRQDLKKRMVQEDDDSWKWLTFEEFTQICAQHFAVPMFGDYHIRLISNNLYSESFPLPTAFSQCLHAYEVLNIQDDTPLSPEDAQLAAKVFTFYEQLTQIQDRYYVKYAQINGLEDLKVTTEPLCSTADLVKVAQIADDGLESKVSGVNLDAGEDEWLSYVRQALDGELRSVEAYFTHQSTEFDNQVTRLKVLALLTMNIPEVTLFKSLPVPHSIRRYDAYQQLLQTGWGYPDFKRVAVYQDPESGSKQKFEISQATIIDDIVEQAEIGILNQTPRDIFITAPTGAGKSVMFQLPALYLIQTHPETRPLTLVISPLIGLMNDQVESMLKKGITNAKTINSALAPSEKLDTIEAVKAGSIDMLYLSPETLQNRGDITQIIGERKIGMVIVDEAHTVVTWGKSFRADYWYLGLYLQKLRKTQKFPIITFTATATIGGRTDMFRDIRNSLNMINPITYIGDSRRDDIWMCIQPMPNATGHDAIELKTAKLITRMKSWRQKRQKTLVYFPTVKLLRQVKSGIDDYAGLGDLTRTYYGNMNPSEKQNSYEDFLTSNALFMFATKAFGMGIDIKDITNVYHYAPTGDVVDYVQEIGRVARNHEVVPVGNAFFDYIPTSDFKYVKQLHGMSTIKVWQLKSAMSKIVQLYKQNKYNRNLVISAADFKYELDLDDSDDANTADNKLKIILLMLEKDFSGNGNYNYAPFVARPKQVFGKELCFVNDEREPRILKSRLKLYLEKVTHLGQRSVYMIDLAKYWRKYHQTISYPAFKRLVFNYDERQKHSELKIFDSVTFASGIQVSWENFNGFEHVNSKAKQVLRSFRSYLEDYAYSGKQFLTDDLAHELLNNVNGIHTLTESKTTVASLTNLCNVVAKQTGSRIIKARVQGVQERFSVMPTYTNFFDSVTKISENLSGHAENRVLDSTNQLITMYYPRSFNSSSAHVGQFETMLAYAGFLESLGGLSFQTANGNDSQIYVRINNITRMEQAIANHHYHNRVLDKIKDDYYRNVAMLEYLFKYQPTGSTNADRVKDYTTFFWSTVEDFFLGTLPSDIEQQEESK